MNCKHYFLMAAALAWSGLGAAADDLMTPPAVREASWGCQVLLCLANPAGWRSVSYCVPPVRRLFDHLKKGRAFPRCDEATSNGTARLVVRQFELCPTGYREPTALGLDDPEAAGVTAPDAPPPTKTCYGKYLGKRLITDPDTGSSTYVDSYDTISLPSLGSQIAYDISTETGAVQRLFPLVRLRAGQ